MSSIEYKRYRRSQIAELADWTPGFDMAGVSVSDADKQAGSPKHGDKIARNPANHADRWLVAADYFAANFEAAIKAAQHIGKCGKPCGELEIGNRGCGYPDCMPKAVRQPEPMSDERMAIIRRAINTLEKDGDEHGVALDLRALLSAQPNGWVSVPREPTPEMWDAAWTSIGLPYRAKLSMHEIKILFEKFHEAMLAAAPKEAR